MDSARRSSWNSFEKSLRLKDGLKPPKGGKSPRGLVRQPRAGKHPLEDLGSSCLEPAKDTFLLVVCERCKAGVIPSALSGHIASSHGGHHHKSKASTKKTKEYNPEIHCGVWMSKDNRHCIKSLTCKDHVLADRRAVTGRSRPFDELLKLHQDRRGQQPKKERGPKVGTAPPPAPPTSAAVKSDSSAPRTAEERVPPTGLQALWPEGEEEHAMISEVQAKPLAMSSFGIQRTAKYGTLFGYHGNSLLTAAQALIRPVSTEGLPSQDQPTTTEDRRHSFPRANQEEGRGSFYTSRKCRQLAPLVPSLPDLPPPPAKGAPPPPTMSPVSPPAAGSPRERPRSLLLMTGNNPNRRKQDQSSVGNHDNSGVVNLTEDEHVNNVSTDQGAVTKSANKVSNSVVNPNSLEHGVPQDTLEPLLASIAVPHIAAISPSKDGSSSSNGSDDLGQPASNVEPRPTVHPGFELAGQYPSTLPPVYMLNGMQQHPFTHGTSAPPHHSLQPQAVEFQYPQMMGFHGGLPFLPTGPIPRPPDPNQHLFMVNSIASQRPFINTHSATFSGSTHMPKLKEFPPTKQSPPSKRRRVHNKDDGSLSESLCVRDRPPGYPQRTSTQGRQSVT